MSETTWRNFRPRSADIRYNFITTTLHRYQDTVTPQSGKHTTSNKSENLIDTLSKIREMGLMSSYITDNFNTLSRKHYIRRATARDYWFDFSRNKLEKYRAKSGDNFCLILYASDVEDDCYVLPFSHVQHLFQDEYLDDRGRWVGGISSNLLSLRRSYESMSISAYYNAFEYLEEHTDDKSSVIKEPEVLYNVGDEIDSAHLIQRIQIFNEQYRQAIPTKQKQLSEYIARPNAVTDYLKKLRNFMCQVCGQLGFVQRNGTRYIEAHHIIELHKMLPGSLCSDNIVIVCATCHRKFHYAQVSYTISGGNFFVITINDEQHLIERNILSEVT